MRIAAEIRNILQPSHVAAAWLAALTSMGGGQSVHAQLAAPSQESAPVQVVRVVDGDTVWVAPAGGTAGAYRKRNAGWQKIRIEGIDAPEICQTYGEQSRRALSRRILQRRVEMETIGVDRYGRVLAHLYLDGQDIGRQQVLAGQAWSYHRLYGDRGLYASEEAQAMHTRQGLFADEAAEYPADFRRRNGSCHAPPGRQADRI